MLVVSQRRCFGCSDCTSATFLHVVDDSEFSQTYLENEPKLMKEPTCGLCTAGCIGACFGVLIGGNEDLLMG